MNDITSLLVELNKISKSLEILHSCSNNDVLSIRSKTAINAQILEVVAELDELLVNYMMNNLPIKQTKLTKKNYNDSQSAEEKPIIKFTGKR